MKSSQSLNKNVFWGSVIVIFLVTIITSLFPEAMGNFFDSLQAWLITHTGWIYILSVAIMLFLALWLIASRLGDIRLGPDHAKPDYSNFSWFAMLFSAGMGTGLMFWGVSEPVMHFLNPPVGEASSIASAKEAMNITMFHWGLHAWAIYASLGVILCYFCYRKELPLLPRSAFYPLIGQKIYGKMGDLVDSLCIIGTLFGVATTLGMGVMQVNAGLNYVFGLEQSTLIQATLIAVITLMATTSVVLGLDGGIKRLSNVNMILAIVLLIVVLSLGDSIGLMQATVQNTGAYLSDIVSKTFNLYVYEKKEKWIGGWTLLYWAWWIAWAPFVGMFIARISRGRTIREFLVGVLFLPTGFTLVWMTAFGNSGINFIAQNKAPELANAVNSNVAIALFKFLELLPFSSLLAVLAVILVITFFVSSSDSGSLVIDTLASGGVQDPPVWQRVFWALTEGVVAAVLLLVGGIEALQTMTIASALPIIVLIMVGTYAFIKSLRADQLMANSAQTLNQTHNFEQGNWKNRLQSLTVKPSIAQAEVFLDETISPAIDELKTEMQQHGLMVERIDQKMSRGLVVKNGDVEDFRYEVKIRSFIVPDYLPKVKDTYFRAEVFLLNGGQDYDIYGYTQDEVIADAVSQYEKHFHYLHLANSKALTCVRLLAF